MKLTAFIAAILAFGASMAQAETPRLMNNGLGFLFAKYAANPDAGCAANTLSRVSADLPDLHADPITWIGNFPIPEAQAARAYGQPKGYETYKIFGSAGGDVFFTYAFVAKDLKRLFVVKPDALGAEGLAMPSEGLRIPSNAIGSSIIRLSRCSEPPVATAAVFKKPISVGAGTDATKLPTVRVVRDVNYRTGPDDSYRKVGTFKRGQVLKFTNFDGNWYEFNIGGRKVYSYRRFFAN